ncbi:hypothetical protein ACEN2J_02125 [Pseudorhodobacter sp. W20_MBD10_FR17]|uniref:hypothetical protein n=1 Tax=Pseudorhodobacter sp. W20_MBD10_FR17 TaxID=3240266 RepID=UPI003F9B1BA2
MDWANAATGKAWVGVAVTGGIAAMCLRDPDAALADAAIYARSGKSYMKHLSSGVAALGASAVFVAALKTNGAA